MIEDLGAAVGEHLDDLQSGRLANVADARLVGDPQQQDLEPRTGFAASLSACSMRSTQKCGWFWLIFPASSMNSV